MALSIKQQTLEETTKGGTAAIYWTWIVLMIATALSWGLGTEEPGAAMSKGVGLLVLTIAFVKIDLVGRHFMELKAAPRKLLHAFDLWCIATLALVGAIYAAR